MQVHFDETQPHAHCFLVPRLRLDHDRIHYKTQKTHAAVKTESGRYEILYKFKTDQDSNKIPIKQYCKMSDYYDYKISCADIFNRYELAHFHKDLSDFLRSHNIPGADSIYTGKTAGKNVSVPAMKEFYRATGLYIEEAKELQKNLEQLQHLYETDTAYLKNAVEKNEFKISELLETISSKNRDLEYLQQQNEQLLTQHIEDEKKIESLEKSVISHHQAKHEWGKSENWGQQNRSWGNKEYAYEED